MYANGVEGQSTFENMALYYQVLIQTSLNSGLFWEVLYFEHQTP